MDGGSTEFAAAQSRRWFGAGRSAHPDAASAGGEAAAQAIERADAELLIVFASEAYDLRSLLEGIRRQAPGVPLIGCSTAGEIAASGPGDAGVVIVAIGGPGFRVSTGVGRNASAQLRSAGADAARCVEELQDADERPHRVLLLLSDGLAGDQQEIVRGAHGVVGAGVPLVGGCAGDDLKMSTTFQFYGDELLRDAVVAAAIASDAPFGIGVRHGWRRVGEAMLVTESADNRVYSLDGEPALDTYLDRLAAPAPARSDAHEFTRFALTHPLGLSRRAGEDHVRFVGEANFDDRSLGCIAEVPRGGLAWFMEGDRASVLEATDAACRDALAPLGAERPLGLLAFDCIARRGVLGEDGIRSEIQQVAACAGGAPVAGFYTYGEIARTRGVNGFHNQTLVVLAVG
jgi:hypothetical protein